MRTETINFQRCNACLHNNDGQCDILGEINNSALCTCHMAGYFDRKIKKDRFINMRFDKNMVNRYLEIIGQRSYERS